MGSATQVPLGSKVKVKAAPNKNTKEAYEKHFDMKKLKCKGPAGLDSAEIELDLKCIGGLQKPNVMATKIAKDGYHGSTRALAEWDARSQRMRGKTLNHERVAIMAASDEFEKGWKSASKAYELPSLKRSWNEAWTEPEPPRPDEKPENCDNKRFKQTVQVSAERWWLHPDAAGGKYEVPAVCSPLRKRPFPKRRDLYLYEVPILIGAVEFDGSPVTRATSLIQALGLGDPELDCLPYPLNSRSFLEQYVKPFFESGMTYLGQSTAEDKFKFGPNAGFFLRLMALEILAEGVLATIDDTDRIWEQLVATVDKERMDFGEKTARRFNSCKQALHLLHRYTAVHSPQHAGCPLWPYVREVAIRRAEEKIRWEMGLWPMEATNLPPGPKPVVGFSLPWLANDLVPQRMQWT